MARPRVLVVGLLLVLGLVRTAPAAVRDVTTFGAINAFLETPRNDPHAAYPDQGHGFRMNGDCTAVRLDHNLIADNAGDGIQFSGTNFDQLSFVDNTVVRNVGDSVSGDPGGASLLWTGNTVVDNGVDRDLVTRGFASAGPTAAFSAVASTVAGVPVVFTNTSSAGSGTLVRTLWDFGDGPPTTDAQPTHLYDAAGIYRVSLVVWDSAGRGARAEQLVQVAASAGSMCATLDCRASGDQCNFPSCDDGAGSCTGVAKPDGSTCDDGLFCTVSDGCTGGLCGGAARDCSDGNRCTADGCNEGAAVCTHTTIPSCGPQDALQQRCLLAMAKSYGKLATTSAKITAGCVKGAAKGTPGALACLTADPRGKLAVAAGKVQGTSDQRCACPSCSLPDFGYAPDIGAATGIVEAASPAATTDVFGTAADLGLVTSSTSVSAARCQQTIYRDAQGLASAYWSGFLVCLKNGLHGKVPPASAPGESFVLGSELAACVGQDPQHKIGRARDRLATDATTSCVAAGVSFSVFAGPCGMQTTPAAFAACVTAAVEDRAGNAIRAAHAL
jgi:PKD repeat protein